jgi:hypothetical protein
MPSPTNDSAFENAPELVRIVCQQAGSFAVIDDVRSDLATGGVLRAIEARRTDILFDWLVRTKHSRDLGRSGVGVHGTARTISARGHCQSVQSNSSLP